MPVLSSFLDCFSSTGRALELKLDPVVQKLDQKRAYNTQKKIDKPELNDRFPSVPLRLTHECRIKIAERNYMSINEHKDTVKQVKEEEMQSHYPERIL